jgi:hypothetical protein
MDQKWFELLDIRRKNFSKSVWIPLRAIDDLNREGKYGFVGYKEEFFRCGSIAVPTVSVNSTKKLAWSDVGINEHSSYMEDGQYISADTHKIYGEDFTGLRLVIDQRSSDDAPSIWHLNQDFVVALGLVREGNSWVCPQDGYTEVARVKINADGKPLLLEVKAQYLKDYLCAREMTLYMTMYYSRDMILKDDSFLTWPNGNSTFENETDRWEGRVMPIHEGGNPYGEKMAVCHVERTDIDETDDVPDISGFPTDENTKSESWEREFEGEKLYRVMGDLWRNEIIEPAKASPKVREDEVASTVFFIIDAEGTRNCGKDLINNGKWLWFKPDVIMALFHRRGGSLDFYSAQTGNVGSSYGHGVHFGVNELGLICVYAKDIGLLPEWQQQIWAGYNISPEGGVSQELLASQVRAKPADTQAPESFLANVFQEINKASEEKIGIKIFREHEVIPELIRKTHRFRAIDEAAFYALAKDLARLTADSLDTDAMQTIVPPPKKTKWGSMKSLENLLSSKYDVDFVREILASLVGVYELRHADAHLPSSKVQKAFELIEIDKTLPYIHQGHQMLHHIVTSLYGVLDGLKKWPNE